MIEQQLEILGAFIVDKLRKELTDQGHRNTGKLIDTLRYEVKKKGSIYDIIIYGQGYAKTVDQGLPPGVKVNVYALAEWVEQKGIASGEKEIKSAAFAIREKIFQEGSPTKNAANFSSNGRRTDFIGAVIDANQKVIVAELFKVFSKSAIFTLSNVIKKNKNIYLG